MNNPYSEAAVQDLTITMDRGLTLVDQQRMFGYMITQQLRMSDPHKLAKLNHTPPQNIRWHWFNAESAAIVKEKYELAMLPAGVLHCDDSFAYSEFIYADGDGSFFSEEG